MNVQARTALASALAALWIEVRNRPSKSQSQRDLDGAEMKGIERSVNAAGCQRAFALALRRGVADYLSAPATPHGA